MFFDVWKLRVQLSVDDDLGPLVDFLVKIFNPSRSLPEQFYAAFNTLLGFQPREDDAHMGFS